jgi:hypothetical protein
MSLDKRSSQAFPDLTLLILDAVEHGWPTLSQMGCLSLVLVYRSHST